MRTASGHSSSAATGNLHTDSGMIHSLQSDSAVESTSLSNDSASNSNSQNDERVIAMIDIERDISQIGQDYMDSFTANGASGQQSLSSSRQSSLKKLKVYRKNEQKFRFIFSFLGETSAGPVPNFQELGILVMKSTFFELSVSRH